MKGETSTGTVNSKVMSIFRLSITHLFWAVKKFSEYGVDDGYVEKFEAALAGAKGEREDDEKE